MIEKEKTFLRLASFDTHPDLVVVSTEHPQDDWEQTIQLANAFKKWEKRAYHLAEDEKESIARHTDYLQNVLYQGAFVHWSIKKHAAMTYLANRFAKIIASRPDDNSLVAINSRQLHALFERVDLFALRYDKNINRQHIKSQKQAKKVDTRLRGGRMTDELIIKQCAIRKAEKELRQKKFIHHTYQYSKAKIMNNMRRNPPLTMIYLIKAVMTADATIASEGHFSPITAIPPGEVIRSYHFLSDYEISKEESFFSAHINKYHLPWALFAAAYHRDKQYIIATTEVETCKKISS